MSLDDLAELARALLEEAHEQPSDSDSRRRRSVELVLREQSERGARAPRTDG